MPPILLFVRLRSALQALVPVPLVLAAASPLPAQTGSLPAFDPIAQHSEVIVLPAGDKFLRWYGHAGLHYFVAVSDNLREWSWAPLIESGQDGWISYEVASTSPKAFYRLHYTHAPLEEGESLELADFDGDGLSNWDEITLHGTHPLQASSNQSGIPDGWSIAQGLDPLSTGSVPEGPYGDADGDGSSNLEEYRAGTDPNAADDFPLRLRYLKRESHQHWSSNPVSGELWRKGSWQAGYQTGNLPAPLSGAAFALDLAAIAPFPQEPPANALPGWGSQVSLLGNHFHPFHQGETTYFTAQLEHARVWIEIPPALVCAREQTFSFVFTGRKRSAALDEDDRPLPPSSWNYQPFHAEVIEVVVPAHASVSGPVDLTPAMVDGGPHTVTHAEYSFFPCGLHTDADRDGVIGQRDHGKIGSTRPWRFWINDDNDAGETGGTDIPQGAAATGTNARNSAVDGVRDLLDFFPVQLDIRHLLLGDFPLGEYRYRLTHPGTSSDPSLRVVLAPLLQPANALAYQTTVAAAKSAALLDSRAVHSTGPLLDETFLAAAAAGKGLLLFEGVKPTTAPLTLKIEKISDNSVQLELPLPLAVTGVEQLFRHKNLRLDAAANEPDKESTFPPAADRLGEPANYPDALCHEDWLVFLHGYNVNGRGARGWHSEAFKRLFWSGSKAKFLGVSWYGDESQMTIGPVNVCPKYYENVENALNTAGHLSSFVNGLEGGKKYLAAHSQGCLVVSEAIARQGLVAEKAFLFDPALPTESLLPQAATLNDPHMEPSPWRPYPEDIKSSEWYRLFPVGDQRSGLTWRGLVHAAVPRLKIFYSAGEEVLSALPLDIPADPGWAGDDPRGQYAFTLQAQLKGLLGSEPDVSQSTYAGELTSLLTHAFEGISPASAHAGWKQTPGSQPPYYGEHFVTGVPGLDEFNWWPGWFEERLTGAGRQAFLVKLRDDPFFGVTVPAGCEGLFDPDEGSAVAGVAWKKRRILGQMIPERTLPAGGAGGSGVESDLVPSLEQKFSTAQAGTIEVFDMQENRNGWPASRPAIQTGNGWRHGDIREVAYVYVWKAWQEVVTDGNLNRDPQSN